MVTPALYSGEELTPQSESEMGLLTPGGAGGGGQKYCHFGKRKSSYFCSIQLVILAGY